MSKIIIDTLYDIATKQAKLDFSGSASLNGDISVAELYLKKITEPELHKLGLSVDDPQYLEVYKNARLIVEFNAAKKVAEELAENGG